MTRNSMAMAAAVLLVGSAGCGDSGGGDGGGGSGGGKVPEVLCDLFSVEEVGAIVGNELEEEEASAGPQLCYWNPSGAGGDLLGASVNFLPGYAYAFDGHVEHIEEVWQTETQPISGVGEKAYLLEYELVGEQVVELGAAAGDDMISASVRGHGLTAAQAEPLARELALLLIERL